MAQPHDKTDLEAHALAGDHAAWQELIKTYHRHVVRVLVKRGMQRVRAEDLANEAWERLIEQQRKGHLTTLVLPGLAIKQATFLAMDDARREQTRRERVLGPALVDRDADPERRLLSYEALARAQEVLTTCNPVAREVFGLMYTEDLSHAEMASRVGLSVQRVRQILCEVRKKMRSTLKEDPHDY